MKEMDPACDTMIRPDVVDTDQGVSSAHISRAVSAQKLLSASFQELAMPLLDPLYNFACWLTHDRTEAEDLVQETFVKALKGFGSFQQGTNFRAWIYRILRNTFLTSRTGLKATMTVPLEEETQEAILAVTSETPESILLDHANQQAIQDALAGLPVIFREVVLLCDVEEISYQEIADTLGIPIGTVMSRLTRARQNLRESLHDKLELSELSYRRGPKPIKGVSQVVGSQI